MHGEVNFFGELCAPRRALEVANGVGLGSLAPPTPFLKSEDGEGGGRVYPSFPLLPARMKFCPVPGWEGVRPCSQLEDRQQRVLTPVCGVPLKAMFDILSYIEPRNVICIPSCVLYFSHIFMVCIFQRRQPCEISLRRLCKQSFPRLKRLLSLFSLSSHASRRSAVAWIPRFSMPPHPSAAN